jgi:protein phosphatase 1G
MISSLPDVKVLDLDDSDEFMIIACDGIWNSMSSQECVDYVRERLNVYPKLSQIVEEVG